ncbi:MAG TPA: site-specific DNA-methyltransferase [Saprospiraceae bacterium]|nr:site-specific DNA-methyltransferase [Saprospiraceae bacterium]
MANKKQLQKLELTWIGKGEEPKLEPRILIENPEYSYGDPDSDNMLINGDNLLALKALEQDYAGKVKCIYIDPPYNTGSAFEHYDDGVEHSLWLSLIRDRLKILHRLLAENGSIWVSIDDNEVHYLKIMMDEIFGRNNFIANNVWQKIHSTKNDAKYLSINHEYVLMYAKNFDKLELNLLPRSDEMNDRYKNPDNDPRGPWQSGDLVANEERTNGYYDVISPSGKVFNVPKGKHWVYAEERMKQMILENRIWFGVKGDAFPRKKRFLSEVQDGRKGNTWWESKDVGHNQEAKREVKSLNSKDVFGTPKPERLIERVLMLASNPNDLILDSFLGSGTTAAVAHKMGRRWIGIELGEHAKTHCFPRLKAVVDGEQGGISKAVNWQGGGGFKFYTLAPSLLKQDKFGNWVISQEYNADMLAAAMAKQEGFKYQPHESSYWKQGQSSEQDFIFTTTQFLTVEALDSIKDEMQPGETLMICCKSFQKECKGKFANITIKKIPQMLLGRCEYGKEDYSLNIINIPSEAEFPELDDEQDFVDDKISVQEIADKKNKIKSSHTPSLFDDVNNNSENPKIQ